MNDSDDRLRELVSRAWPLAAERREPSFDSSWQAATTRQSAARKRYQRFAAAAAIAAAVVIVVNMPAQTTQPYIEVADLLESTYWSAPSDVLLPDRQFDIYQELPVIFESTEPTGGSLL